MAAGRDAKRLPVETLRAMGDCAPTITEVLAKAVRASLDTGAWLTPTEAGDWMAVRSGHPTAHAVVHRLENAAWFARHDRRRAEEAGTVSPGHGIAS